ncbi:MAG: serine hydrolase domain-containing protein [Solirubrobacterales bacterium]
MKMQELKRGLSRLLPALLVVMVVAFGWAGSAAASCKSPLIQTVDGCTQPSVVTQELTRIVKGDKQASKLQAVIARVDIDGKPLLRRAFGNSQTGVPARPDMNFRIGSMTIPILSMSFYQLRDEGKLKLNYPISTWLPELPRASEIDLRMLMNNTSGYLDWIQGNTPFLNEVLADPFRTWTGNELLTTALDRGFACDPGTCFNYAHTNYLILGSILRKIGPEYVVPELKRRVLRPLDMDLVFSRLAPIPKPELSAFTVDRNIFEESTGWSPSWGLGNGMLATASIDEVAKLAKGVLSGKTLSPASRKDMVKQYGPDIAPDSTKIYFAQGVIMAHGWRRQNPFFNGYMGNVAWFPKGKIGVSLEATTGKNTTAGDGVNVTDEILVDIAAYLTPNNSPSLTPPPG